MKTQLIGTGTKEALRASSKRYRIGRCWGCGTLFAFVDTRIQLNTPGMTPCCNEQLQRTTWGKARTAEVLAVSVQP